MSRSKRKHPVITDQQHRNTKLAKRFANQCVRRATDVPDGKAYKKFSCSWNICDYKSYITKFDMRKYEWLGGNAVYRK